MGNVSAISLVSHGAGVVPAQFVILSGILIPRTISVAVLALFMASSGGGNVAQDIAEKPVAAHTGGQIVQGKKANEFSGTVKNQYSLIASSTLMCASRTCKSLPAFTPASVLPFCGRPKWIVHCL
jgi:hypothetical protein